MSYVSSLLKEKAKLEQKLAVIERDQKAAVAGLATAKAIVIELLGSPDGIEEYWQASNYDGSLHPHESALSDNLVRILKGRSHWPVERIVEKCGELAALAHDISQTTVAARIRELEVDAANAERYLESRGHAVRNSDGSLTFQMSYFFDMVFLSVDRLKTFDSSKHLVVKDVKQRLDSLSQPVRDIYAADYLDEIMHYDEASTKSVERTVLQYIRDGDAIAKVDTFMASLYPSYQALGDMHQSRPALKMIDEHVTGSRTSKIFTYGPVFAQLEVAGIEMRSLEALLTCRKRAQDDPDFKELLRFAERNVAFVNSSRAIWRNQELESESAVSFIQDYFTLPSTIEGKTIGDIVTILLVKNIAAVPVLINNALAWQKDPKLNEIVDIAENNSSANVILRDYFNYGETGERNKQNFMLALGKAAKDAVYIKHTRRLLSGIDDNSIPVDISPGTVSSAVKALSKGTQTSTTMQKRQRIQWIDMAVDTVGAELRKAHELLSAVGLENRLRYVFRNHPEQVRLFCQHVDLLSDSGIVQAVFSDNYMFTSYVNRLSDGTILTDDLRTAIAKGGNAYKIFKRVFEPQEIHFTSDPGETANVIEEIRLNQDYKRIVVIGGRFSTERQDVLSSRSPLPIVFLDYNLMHKQHIGNVRGTDIVVFDISSLDHTTYYTIKGHCKQYDIPFTEARRNGVVDAAREMLALK